jgi:hypothetical protein
VVTGNIGKIKGILVDKEVDMGRAIIKIKDKYFEWSSIVDAPVTYGMSKDELKSYIKGMYGEKGLRELPTRLLRVEKTGTSFVDRTSLDDLISFNRAGENEENLTKDEIYQIYVTEVNHEPKRKVNGRSSTIK